MKIRIDLQSTLDRSYDVEIAPLKKLHFDKKLVIVTNTTIKNLHEDFILSHIQAKELHVFSVADGEEYKNMQTLTDILRFMFEAKLNRGSMLVAFGGGVIGDMTGFAAAIYNRGIDFVQIPTTLLSMVDASVGGKTGINNEFGKNLIGAFHQPKAVYIDPFFLKTLPRREFNAGIAEIIKMAASLDEDFFSWCEVNDLYDEVIIKQAIARSVKIKARVVVEDEKESGLRALLNYGHTFGHVIEKLTNYEQFLHGECVAMGMIMANEMAVLGGFLAPKTATRIAKLLQRYGLDIEYKIDNVEQFYDMFFLDKKALDDSLNFVVLQDIAKAKIRQDITKELLFGTLEKFRQNI